MPSIDVDIVDFTHIHPLPTTPPTPLTLTSSFIVHRSSFIVHRSSFIVHRSSFIVLILGSILIAINPFKPIAPLYNEKSAAKFSYNSLKGPADTSEPHVWDIARMSYSNLLVELRKNAPKDTAILISGESGSGKTETSKYLLTYLTKAGTGLENFSPRNSPRREDRRPSFPSPVCGSPLSQNSATGIMDRILESNPILEAFGNAKTIRNDNSSRFGKFVSLAFDKKGRLTGGKISVYLLENVRVVNQQKGDQNFHIFYQMIAGACEDQRSKWKLSNDVHHYTYLMKRRLPIALQDNYRYW